MVDPRVERKSNRIEHITVWASILHGWSCSVMVNAPVSGCLRAPRWRLQIRILPGSFLPFSLILPLRYRRPTRRYDKPIPSPHAGSSWTFRHTWPHWGPTQRSVIKLFRCRQSPTLFQASNVDMSRVTDKLPIRSYSNRVGVLASRDGFKYLAGTWGFPLPCPPCSYSLACSSYPSSPFALPPGLTVHHYVLSSSPAS